MQDPERIGIISTIVIIVSVLVATDGFTVLPDLKQAIIGIPGGIVVAIFVWYLTSNTDRKNRKYTRATIVDDYLQCIAIVNGLILIPQNRQNIIMFLDLIQEYFNEIQNRAELQAHLLHAEEVDKFEKESVAIRVMFSAKLRVNANNIQLLREFLDFLRNNLSEYIKRHRLNEFNEYVLD